MNEAVVLFCGIFMGLGIAEITQNSVLREAKEKCKRLDLSSIRDDSMFEVTTDGMRIILTPVPENEGGRKDMFMESLNSVKRRRALKDITRLSQEEGLYE